MLDADRLSHVHARFPGEIVELGPGDGRSPAVCFGQRVRKGQLLAVIWSRDLGEKKSDLIDALSQLRVDEDSLARISKAAAEGSVPERILRDTERKVEADRIAVSRAVRTLQSWRISKEEIDQVRAEADRLRENRLPRRRRRIARRWSRNGRSSKCSLRWTAPIIERNVALGDLVDTNIDLFKVADLSRLRVVAHAYEEDLPSLGRLERRPSRMVGCRRFGPGRGDPAGAVRPGRLHHRSQSAHGAGDGLGRQSRWPAAGGAVRHRAPGDSAAQVGGRGPRGGFVRRRRPDDGLPASRGHAGIRPPRRSSSRGGAATRCSSAARSTAEERQRGLEPLAAGQLVVTSRIAQLTASLNELKSASKSAMASPRQTSRTRQTRGIGFGRNSAAPISPSFRPGPL